HSIFLDKDKVLRSPIEPTIRILPFKFRGVPQPGVIAYEEVRRGAIIQNVKAVEGDPHKHRGQIQWRLTPLIGPH
ncbi:hypothetical protein ACFL3A_13435, partial [Pseudomonadota bacterium]